MSGPAAKRPGALAYVRSALFAGWMFATAILLGLLCLPLMFGPPQGAMIPIQVWARAQFWALRWLVGLRVEVRGRERLPQGAFLLASKHQSMLDTLVAMTLTPWPCIVLKKELMRIPIFGWYAWKAQMIAIDRAGGSTAMRDMVAAARRAQAQGRQVLIYPEGTRRAPGAPPAYKGGTGVLYTELEMICTPLATNSGVVWPAYGLLKHPGVATFDVLAAIPPGLSRKGFMSSLEREIESASNALLPREPVAATR